jgi:hypothetical protein
LPVNSITYGSPCRIEVELAERMSISANFPPDSLPASH